MRATTLAETFIEQLIQFPTKSLELDNDTQHIKPASNELRFWFHVELLADRDAGQVATGTGPQSLKLSMIAELFNVFWLDSLGARQELVELSESTGEDLPDFLFVAFCLITLLGLLLCSLPCYVLLSGSRRFAVPAWNPLSHELLDRTIRSSFGFCC